MPYRKEDIPPFHARLEKLIGLLMAAAIPIGYVWISKHQRQVRDDAKTERLLQTANAVCDDAHYDSRYRDLCIMKCQVDMGAAMFRKENQGKCESQYK